MLPVKVHESRATVTSVVARVASTQTADPRASAPVIAGTRATMLFRKLLLEMLMLSSAYTAPP
jgi:hypothetical protein